MARLGDILPGKARALAEYIGRRYGDGDPELSTSEAGRALRSAAQDPVLRAKLSDLFGAAVPARPADLLQALVGGRRASSSAALAVGERPGGPGALSLHPDGTFSLGAGPAPQSSEQAGGVLYEAALLVGHGENPYASAPAATKARAFTHLLDVAQAGAARAESELTPSETTMAMKSGTATLLLSLAEASGDDAGLRGRVLDAYLGLSEKEPHRGLRTSMLLNLDGLRASLGLSEAQAARLDAQLEQVLPKRPPYEEWFANGNDTVRIQQYVHSDYWDLYDQAYLQRGFTKTELPDGAVRWEGQAESPSGETTRFHIEARLIPDSGPDRPMLRDMNDPDTHIQLYSGHSGLGSNMAQALKLAPTTEAGTKLTFLWLCRGKQNIADYSNRFPRSHLITTQVAPDGYSIVPMSGALIDTVVSRGSYRDMAKQGDPSGYHLFPDDRRLYDHRDFDEDGKLDGGVVPDRVFDIYPRAPQGKRVDFRPGVAADPAKVDGSGLINALGFANTVLTYHLEYGDKRSPIDERYVDRFFSEGFATFEGDEFVRITEREVDGEAKFGVAVNSRYADLSEEALGVLLPYELNRFISGREADGGALTLDDKVRGLLLGAEYLQYMVGAGRYADTLVSNLMAANGWPSGLGFTELNRALKQDAGGYVSSGAVAAFKRAHGSQLGDGAGIR